MTSKTTKQILKVREWTFRYIFALNVPLIVWTWLYTRILLHHSKTMIEMPVKGILFFLFAPQHPRIKGCSWPKRSDLSEALWMLLVISGNSLAGVLGIQNRLTGGDWSQDSLDLDFLCVSILQFSNFFSSFPQRCRESGGTAFSPRAESDTPSLKDFPLLRTGEGRRLSRYPQNFTR